MESFLTKRELQICYLSVDGLTCKEMSKKLIISIHTVYKHRVNFLTKLGKKNVAQGRICFNDKTYDTSVFSSLTKREITICLLLIRGDTYKEIAKKNDIQPSTVAKHREHIYQKLNIHGVIELSKVICNSDES
ncbi:helix-turn-helix transcriptional regulator, partial [Salmonella enterica]|nr:helix-turn-helix transcriptional regulator [Salmonella enterica]